MRKIKAFWIICLITNLTCYSKIIETDIVTLSKIYNQFHAFSDLTDDAITVLESYKGTDLETVSIFIKELCTKNNEILSKKYLIRPDSISLRYFHIIVLVNYNMFKSKAIDNNELAKKLLIEEFDVNESIRFYYSSLFNSIVNKNKNFDYSKVNIKLDSINLIDDTQKGVFFLEFTQSLGFQAIAYIKYAQKPRYETAYNYFQLLPKINSLPYYKYSYFGFPDVKMLLNGKKQSFKKYYLQNYFDLLLCHYDCLRKLNKNETEINDLLLGSILRDRNYYDYFKDKEILESIFKRVD
jgi:hypothetical protein